MAFSILPSTETGSNPVFPHKPNYTTPELYQAVTQAHEITDYRNIQPIHLAGFICPTADAKLNARLLRNHGYNLANPKPKRRKRQRSSTSRKNFNAGNLVSQLRPALQAGA